MKYNLEIFCPGSFNDVACVMESDSPFLSIHKGDLINPRGWSQGQDNLVDAAQGFQYGIVLRVTGIEHIISGLPDDPSIARHKVCIFTEALEDVAESRFPK